MTAAQLRHPWMYALGRDPMPERIVVAGKVYAYQATFKHDFFAATGLYAADAERVVLKVARATPLLGLPLRWLGRWLCRREVRHYEVAAGVPGVPRLLGRLGESGFVHEFVPGHPLQRAEHVGDDFFERLASMLAELHARGLAYADLEKRENVLVDEAGRPALVDFQIAWHWPAVRAARRGVARWLPESLGRRVLAALMAADLYHLGKHRRRHRPDQLDEQALAESRVMPSGVGHMRRWNAFFQGLRRRALLRLTGNPRSPKQEGHEFLAPGSPGGKPCDGPPSGNAP